MESKNVNRGRIALIITVSILSIALTIFIALYAVSMAKQNELKVDLENIYQRNFTELVDNVNNTEVKLSKVIVSDYNSYAKKLLNEISKNTTSASVNLSALPISINGIEQTTKFINQVSGYTQTLANKLEKGESITDNEIATLESIRNSFAELKSKLNDLSYDIYNGNIYNESISIDGDYNKFTLRLQNVKAGDVDYPTMIYDGPFSESTVNQKIKNLNFSTVSKEVAYQKIEEIFTGVNMSECEYLGETNGRFDTYDYKICVDGNNATYVQVTKNGAKLLTMSTADYDNSLNYTLDQAIQISKDFTSRVGIKNTECVWSEISGGDVYINLAPVENDIILYPDLVKVKVDLASGNVNGFEATSYYTNHTQRNLPYATISKQTAQQKLPLSLTLNKTSLVLAPLEYNREVLCYELKCTGDDGTYYVYINAQDSTIENILKVVQSDNGNLLV